MDSQPYRSPRYRRQPPKPAKSKIRRALGLAVVTVVLLIGLVVVVQGNHGNLKADQTGNQQTTKPAAKTSETTTKTTGSTGQTATTKPAANNCSSNASGQLVLVSVSQRHLWACNGTSQLYDSAVVTGMENLPADLTPTGTYHIYGKYVNTYLKGSDSTGSWNDYVNYWMPWLHNQYGSYGFHDATWRAPNDFGNISPYSSNASHGCVELPLATAKWLYDWAVIGTTVTIES